MPADFGLIFPAVLTAIVGLVAVSFTARKLKLDLFEKRYKAYREVHDLMQALIKEIDAKESSDDSVKDIREKLKWAGGELRFLFGPDVEEEYKTLSHALERYQFGIDRSGKPHADYGAARAAEMTGRSISMGIAHSTYRLEEACLPYLRQYGVLNLWRHHAKKWLVPRWERQGRPIWWKLQAWVERLKRTWVARFKR